MCIFSHTTYYICIISYIFISILLSILGLFTWQIRHLDPLHPLLKSALPVKRTGEHASDMIDHGFSCLTDV